MIYFKLFNIFYTKKKIVLIALLIFALLIILINYSSEVIKSYIDEKVTSPSTRIHLINIAKVAIPLKNRILMRDLDDKIALLESTGSCVFCNLTQGNFKGNDLEGVDLRYAILIGADLSNTNLSGVNLSNANLNGVNLSEADLSNTNLSGVNLSNANLNGAILHHANLTGTNLSGVDLSNKDLTGANLSKANLNGAILNNVNLRGANLSGVDFSNTDLTGAIMATLSSGAEFELSIKNLSNSNWPALNEIQKLNVTRYDLSGDEHYLATREGFLFESKNNESRLVLNLNTDANSPFYCCSGESGFFSVASQNNLVYVSYTSQDSNGIRYLVVDEYSMDFSKVRNIIKIPNGGESHFGGSLSFDSLGKLYLSVGDSGAQFEAQNLNTLNGKILRLDVSDLKLVPEIIAYGIRNALGVTIDSKDRMFVMQCGWQNAEAVYLLNDLYSGIPANFGWPVFEGTMKFSEKANKPSETSETYHKLNSYQLTIEDLLPPIFETTKRPGCLTAGVYLNDIESFLFGDFYGFVRLLKEKENGEWDMIHEYKQEESIWALGLDEKTKKIFVAPNNLELEILVDQVLYNQ